MYLTFSTKHYSALLQNITDFTNNHSDIEIKPHIPTNYPIYDTDVTIDVRKCRQVSTNKNIPDGDTCQELLSSANTPTYQPAFLSWPYNANYNPVRRRTFKLDMKSWCI